jgi:hypothetical protein
LSASLQFTPLRRFPLLVGAGMATVLMLAGTLNPAPAHASFIVASITFTNTGPLPLRKRRQLLDHGCWVAEAPLDIPPLTTVTWQSDSCGLATGTEGWVEYQPYGAPDNQRGRFYWDVPFIGTNTATNSAPTGCPSSQSGPGDGNHVSIFFTMGCGTSSNDGIADVWKLHGAEFDPGGGMGKQFIDLPAMGAVVGQNDIFVHLNWMQGTLFGEYNQKIHPNAIKRWVELYAANGYRLHVDQGPDSTLDFNTNAKWGPLSRAQAVPYQANLGTAMVDASGNVTSYNWTAYNTIKAASFTPTGRAEIFHHMLAAHQLANLTNSGIGRTPGVDVIISLGAFTNGVGSENEQLATLLHEFGHNLGLEHGGRDKVNYKPNYFSVMNYAFQFPGITRNAVTTWDYSHKVDSQLVEVIPPGLNESSGVPSAAGYSTVHFCPAAGGNPAARLTAVNAAGYINWDCDGLPTPNPNQVSADINNDPAQPANTLGTLTGSEDWSRLNLRVGGIGSFSAGIPAPPIETIVDDPTPQMVQEILPVDSIAPVSSAVAAPAPNTYGWNNGSVTVTVTATDQNSGVARIEYNLDSAGYVQYASPVAVANEGAHTFLYRAIDRSSNVEAAKSLSFKIDTTPPTVSYTGSQGTYSILATLNISCSATDPVSGGVASGVASTTCQNIAGPAYNLDPSTTYSATATDYAGNAGTGSLTIQVVVTYDDLCTLGKRFVSNRGVALSNSMCAQLNAAKTAQAQGNLTAKASAIRAYMNDVDAGVKAGYLTHAQGTILKKWAALL